MQPANLCKQSTTSLAGHLQDFHHRLWISFKGVYHYFPTELFSKAQSPTLLHSCKLREHTAGLTSQRGTAGLAARGFSSAPLTSKLMPVSGARGRGADYEPYFPTERALTSLLPLTSSYPMTQSLTWPFLTALESYGRLKKPQPMATNWSGK
jgi:hypothetical protein